MLGLLVPQQCKSVLINAIHLHHRQRAIVVVLQQKSEWKTAEAGEAIPAIATHDQPSPARDFLCDDMHF